MPLAPLSIEIRNFGPIRSFDFNVRDDFVLIVGENNVGKSYAISLVYLTLKSLTSASTLQLPFDFYLDQEDIGSSLPWLKQFEQDQLNSNESAEDIGITDAVTCHLKELFEIFLLPELRGSLLGTFNTLTNLQNKLSNEPVSLTLRAGNTAITFQLSGDDLAVGKIDLQGHRFAVRKVKQNRTYLDGDRETIIYFPQENPSQFESNYRSLIWRLFSRFANSFIVEISDLHYLPASRSGLYQALSAFGQIVAELAKNRTMLSRKIELPGISEPLSDYFLKLSEARPTSAGESPTSYHQIAELIEKDILHGDVEFDSKTKRITYSPHNIDLKLDLSATSSMVSEISPIVSYLKLVLPTKRGLRRQRIRGTQQKQIVIIEEPEAHLHPEIQRKLVTIFAELVKTTNTKLVMTSHSNYIFNETSNLIIANKIDPNSFRAIQFKGSETGSTTHDLKVSVGGIQDENFINTAEAIYQERLELLQKAKKQ